MVWLGTVALMIEQMILIIVTAAMGGTYEFARVASANLREKDDSWNPAIGGFLAGAVLGLRCQLLLVTEGFRLLIREQFGHFQRYWVWELV